ncbi:uncharacterized protein LAESUDRAFT_752198 [Laetiporus sulphureus 93-53]|uniref:Aminoglycoside phosphotransferase domain-containing protein n=1 Tax=Laetiporus sulphureus 93-53 TaxID=1314785 RepID=A0A165CB72_9APHY|nr:uncharacterized protein LAESUDRAFT_752198 [Laetiporus sulphureus 93-53]KZT02494.1 hypothetical protein LAESUDRAFT_752198 [Laetiporus sulphureus 93-53]
MPADNLETIDGVLAYVAETQFTSDHVAPLTGGSGNYAYRLHLRTPYREYPTVVLKHAKPYVAALLTLAFSLDRQRYEVEALRKMKSILPTDSLVTVPEVFLFDDTANVIVMSDCGEGSLTLKQLLLEDPPPAQIAAQIGRALGEFLGRLHGRGSEDEAFSSFFSKNEEGKKLSAFATYGRLMATLTDGTLPTLSDPPLEIQQERLDVVARVAAETQDAMLTTRDTVAMGDFWPGNVLVVPRRDDQGRVEGVERLFVIDWELAKTGLAGLDVGQFAAELYLVSTFVPAGEDAANSVLTSFLRAYRETRGGSMMGDVARRAVVHVGAHLVTWTPRIPWGSKEKVREVVHRGVDYLVQGSNDGAGSFGKTSVIAELFYR